MIFITEYDIITEPARSIIIILTTILFIGAIIMGIISLLSARNPNNKMSYKYSMGIGIFFIAFGIGRLVFMIHDYFAPDILDIVLWKMATIIIFSGLISFIFTIETYVYTKTKHAFTIIGVFILVMVIISELEIARIFIYIGNIVLLTVPFLIYLIIIKGATGDLKKRAIIIVIGMLIFAIGQGTSLFELIGIMDKVSSSIFAPPVTLAGLSLLGIGLISESK